MAAFNPGRTTVTLATWAKRLGCWTAAIGCALAACACSASNSPAPLQLLTAPKSVSVCLPAPNPAAGVDNWNSPVGEATVVYYDRSADPITIDSVQLLEPHNLVLHTAVLYEMLHDQHALPLEASWSREGTYVPARQWALRQSIPGAAIPQGNGPFPSSAPQQDTRNTYQIALSLSDAKRGGGWATGVVIRYESGGNSFTETVLTGLAIDSSPVPLASVCQAPLKAIAAAWRST